MNNVVKWVGDFLLTSWIWNITFDIYHPIVTGIIMFCLLRMVMHRRRLESFAISTMLQLCTFGLFTAKVIFGVINFLGWQYEPLPAEEAMNMMHTFIPSLYVGLLYALFQSLFFILGRCIWRYNLTRFLTMTWVSNFCGALISYMLINIVEVYYYIG